ESDAGNRAYFVPSERDGHHRFDLPGYVTGRLRGLDIAAVDDLPLDTCADADRFFSYRRTTHDGGGDYGRLLSAIAVRPSP
ncbi:MAG: laccase domain-containing protein, partial [Rhodospirillales bacterium]|nr:laccase domain-containing protein [Rhodospirillales bacterium]